MATKSILKDVKIKDKKLAHTFVDALSDSNDSRYKQVQMTRECEVLTGEKIKEFFDRY